MNIRTAVACALAVFLLSFALIVGVGLAQPVHAVAVNAAPPVQQSDVSQLKRDFLQVQQSESLPPAAVAPEPQNATQNTSVQPAPQQQPPQPVPVVAQPPPPPEYYYTTRAS